MKDLKTILEVGRIDLYKNVTKTFGKEKLEELGFDDNIEKVQTRS